MANKHLNIKQKVIRREVSEGDAQKRVYLQYGFLLFLVCLSVFGAVLGFDYIVLDDPVHTIDNPLLRSLDWDTLFKIWKAPYFGFYIPVTYSIWLLFTQFIQGVLPHSNDFLISPQFYHGFNLLWHMLNSFLVYLILNQILKTNLSLSSTRNSKTSLHAFIGALFFAIHPLQVETVSWISEFKDLCSTFFSLACLFSYLSFRNSPIKGESSKRKGKFSKISPFLFFLLAILSKPSASVLPFFILILNVFILAKPWRASLKTPLIWFLISIPILILTKSLQQDVNIEAIAPWWSRPWIAVDSLSFYLYKTIWPQSLGVDYGRTPSFIMSNRVLLLEFLLPLLFFSIFSSLRRKNPLFLGGILLFLAGLAPVSGLVPFAFQSFSSVTDHYLYLPLFGFSLCISSFLAHSKDFDIHFKKSFQIKISMPLICILISLALGIRSFDQVAYWKNSVTLLRHTLEVNEKSYLSHFNLVSPLMEMGDSQGSLDELRATLKIRPDYIPAQLGLALRYKNDHQCSLSIPMIKMIIQDHPKPQGIKLQNMLAGAYAILSLCYSEVGQTQEAEFSINQAHLLQQKVHEEDGSL